MLIVTNEIRIPEAELDISFARSSGPGGQNVNKVNSKAVLRWNARESPSLPLGPKLRFFERFGSRLTTDGEIVLHCDEHRDQGRNREECIAKLSAMLFEIAYPPKPRKKTKPTRSSKKRREHGKRHNAEKKKSRGRVNRDF